MTPAEFKAAGERLGYTTQAEFAGALGISQAQVSRKLSGKRAVTERDVRQIAALEALSARVRRAQG